MTAVGYSAVSCFKEPRVKVMEKEADSSTRSASEFKMKTCKEEKAGPHLRDPTFVSDDETSQSNLLEMCDRDQKASSQRQTDNPPLVLLCIRCEFLPCFRC